MSRLRFCLSLYGTTEEICDAIAGHPQADLFEIRLDLSAFADPARIRNATPKPLIFASHAKPELLPPAADFADYIDVGPTSATDPRHIVSIHAKEGIPAELWLQYGGDHITKIVLETEDYAAMHELLLLNERFPGRALCFAMGDAGAFSRVLSGFHGAPWIYCSDEGRPTAAGQFTLTELTDVYRLRRFDSIPEIFGIVGDPVTHSRSPHYHNSRFAEGNRPRLYLPFRCSHPRSLFHWAPRLGIRGFSITHPHKEAAAAILDESSAEVRLLRSCNTVYFRDGRVLGINTDVDGVEEMLRASGVALAGARMVVLGAGSSARTVATVARPLVRNLRFLNRTVEKARAVAAEFQADAGALQDLHSVEYDVLFNTTPVGLREGECPVDPSAIRPGSAVFDAIYNPPETTLLKRARAIGCSAFNGEAWFVAQAAAQSRWWQSL